MLISQAMLTKVLHKNSQLIVWLRVNDQLDAQLRYIKHLLL